MVKHDRPGSVRPERVRHACIAYAVLHAAAQLSAAFFEAAPAISLWYPPAGLALALLVLLGPRYAGVVFVAHLATALLSKGVQAGWPELAFPLLITANYAGLAWVIRRLAPTTLAPANTSETLRFASLLCLAPAGIALTGTGLLVAIGTTPASRFSQDALLWWAGDLTGLITVVPAALVFGAPWIKGGAGRYDHLESRHPRSAWLRALALLFCIIIGFFTPLPRSSTLYLCFLPLVWICLFDGLRWATLATLAITMGSLAQLRTTGTPPAEVINFLVFELAVTVVGLGLGSSVSRRNRAEARLAASEAQLDRAVAGAQLGLWTLNLPTGEATYSSRSTSMLGYKPGEVEPHLSAWKKLVHPDDRSRVENLLSEHIAGKTRLYQSEYRVRARDQQWRWIFSRGSVVLRDAENRPLTVSGTHVDITDRKRAESEANRLLDILSGTTDFVLTSDLDQFVLHANRSLLRLLGRSAIGELRGKSFREVFPPEALERLQKETIPAALASGAAEGETVLLDADGTEVPVSLVALTHRDADGLTLSFVMRDISRQKQTEAERLENERRMLQIQKTESLGVLAGGIAHDFNNLLTAMLGYANLARLELPAESSIHHPLSQIETAAIRAAGLCKQMLAYAGRAPLDFAEVELNELIEEMGQLLHISVGVKIQLELELQKPLHTVVGSASQLQQCIMNLVLNAAEAIGQKPGRITIRTRCRTLQTAELKTHYSAPGLAAGDYVIMEVEDTGCGIAPELITRIFEPFFTTKFTGHGLGLAAVTGTVKSHNGAVHVVSTVGSGSTFHLLFPSSKHVRAARPPRLEPASPEYPGSGTVLVVEDETPVQLVVGSLLSSLGFKPLFASDGADGVELFRRHHKELRFVLLDLTMPRVTGEQAFYEMERIAPGTPILLMSGYSESLTLERFARAKPAAFLSKPFTRDTLMARLQPLLASPPRGSG